jgi:hypothetical protein
MKVSVYADSSLRHRRQRISERFVRDYFINVVRHFRRWSVEFVNAHCNDRTLVEDNFQQCASILLRRIQIHVLKLSPQIDICSLEPVGFA